MADNCEDVGLNQHDSLTSCLFGFQTGTSDLTVTPSPTMSLNNEGRNNLFMSDSLEYRELNSKLGFDDHTVTHQLDDLKLTSPTVKQNNITGNGILTSHDGITLTSPSSGQNSVPHWNKYRKFWSATNHVGSSSRGNHTSNNLRNRYRNIKQVNKSPSKTVKRIRFRFATWAYEEKKVMDRELEKLTSLPVINICKKIAVLLPRKSIRDVAMRIQWLINHQKLDNIWFWEEPSVEGDLSDFNFYMPDNPNDPDLLAIQNKFGVGAVKRNIV